MPVSVGKSTKVRHRKAGIFAVQKNYNSLHFSFLRPVNSAKWNAKIITM